MGSLEIKLTKLFVGFAIAVFTLSAVGKLSSDFADPRLRSHDAFISFVPMGRLLIIAGLVEMLVVAFLAWAYVHNPAKGAPVVLWLCSLLVAYRLGFFFSPHVTGTCNCFGVGSVLGKWGSKLDGASMVLLFILLIGGFVIWTRSLLMRSRYRSSPHLRKIAMLLVTMFISFRCYSDTDITFNPPYTAEGVVEEDLLNVSGTIVRTNMYPFKATVDNTGRWQLVWQMYFPQWSLTSTEYISYNGTDVFSVVYADKHLDKELKPVNNLPLEEHEHPARVCRGPFPTDYSSIIGLLWIAFVGGEYITQAPMSQPPDLLVSRARLDPAAWSTDCQYKLLPESPNPLIASAMFVLNRAKVFQDLMAYPEIDEPTDPEKANGMLHVLQHLRATKDEDLLRSAFSLSESKILGNVRIPTRFFATNYSPPDSVGGRFPAIEWAATVTNIITRNATIDLLPDLKGRINVEDRRFKLRTKTRFVNDIWYMLNTNGWVLSTNDQRFQGANSVPLLSRQSIIVQRSGRVISLVLISALTLLPVIVLGWKYLQRRTRNVP